MSDEPRQFNLHLSTQHLRVFHPCTYLQCSSLFSVYSAFYSFSQVNRKKNDGSRKLCKVSSSKKVDVSSTLFHLFLILTRKSLGHFDVLLTKFAHGVLSQSKILQVNGQMLLRINLRFHRMEYLLTLMFHWANEFLLFLADKNRLLSLLFLNIFLTIDIIYLKIVSYLTVFTIRHRRKFSCYIKKKKPPYFR